MNWGRVAKVLLVLRWVVVAGLVLLGSAALISSRSLGPAVAFLLAAASICPPVQSLWKHYCVRGASAFVSILLTLIGLVILGNAAVDRKEREAAVQGWISALDRERGIKAGHHSPTDWKPHREAAEAEEQRLKAVKLEQELAGRAAAEEATRREEAQCKVSLNCWAEKHHIRATSSCRGLIERLAQYQFEWIDKWHEPKFSHFRWKSLQLGTVTYAGDRIKFQNGFGAWQFYIYECDFNPNSGQVVDVRAMPGRL